MRTTLTLDDDVAVLLKRAQARRRSGLKRTVNDALRRGLLAMEEPLPPTRRFKTRSVSLGKCLVGNVDDVAEVLAIAEGESHR